MQKDEMKEIGINQINVDETFNCRGKITRNSVIDLMSAIEKQGLIQPIVVRTYPADEVHEKKYDLIAGFRRLTSANMLGWTKIGAVVKVEMDKNSARILNLQENIIREDLTLWEEADALRRLVVDLDHLNEVELCEEVGISRGYFQPRMTLTRMPEQVQQLAHEGWMGCQAIRDLNKFSDDPEAFAKEVQRLRSTAAKTLAGGKKVKKLQVRTTKKDKRNPAALAKGRNRKQINAVLEHLVDSGFAGHPATRALAWAGGNISDLELCVDLKSAAEEEGFSYDFDSTGFTDIINETV